MYRSMIKMYYRGVSVAIVVYDVGDRDSFECVGEWLNDVREKQQQRVLQSQDSGPPSYKECVYYVIGNKCDLDDEDKRQVAYEEGEQWVKDYVYENCERDDEIDISFMEVSAKNGTNISLLFEEISSKLLDRHNHMLKAKGIKNKFIVDPSHNLSYNFNQNSQISSEGPGSNRIEIVDLTHDQKQKQAKKDDSCCKSC
uniref:Uncharacterized protein n=1 Tax=Strombidium rassoulzadegani TaxID=1082188 RepID=A0A7S3CLT4_9SPIT|mmetsp:Transcript_16359/g.27660  ORF Transcript_16359/g.27660 Transcript_16359/m.27660 type:complete len:198 (+) Transcript_16359:237-830(+)